jgi:hypothetical protein
MTFFFCFHQGRFRVGFFFFFFFFFWGGGGGCFLIPIFYFGELFFTVDMVYYFYYFYYYFTTSNALWKIGNGQRYLKMSSIGGGFDWKGWEFPFVDFDRWYAWYGCAGRRGGKMFLFLCIYIQSPNFFCVTGARRDKVGWRNMKYYLYNLNCARVEE